MFIDIDELEDMTDEEIDEYFRPKKQNNRKSLLPLFVYLILEKHSSEDKPLRQKDIMFYLSERPFELKVERKALARTIYTLADSNLGIVTDSKLGTWFER